jgi:hypothetical protein
VHELFTVNTDRINARFNYEIYKYNNKNTYFTKLNNSIQNINHIYNDKRMEPKEREGF